MSICYKCDACGKTFEKPVFYKTKKVDCIDLTWYGVKRRTGDVVMSIDACGKTFEKPVFYKTKKVDCIDLTWYGVKRRTGDVVMSIDVCPDCLAAVLKTLEDRKEQS